MKHLLTLLLLSLFAGSVGAANVFVRQGAGGANNGTNWTNAFAAMPTPSAGNTYYVADGSYGSVTISASNVTIKKCSPSDGVSSSTTGYDSTYCDGKATFSGIDTSGTPANVTIDGTYRNESDWSDYAAYGFTLSGGFSSIDDFGSTQCVTEFTIKYVHLGQTPSSAFSGSYADNVLKGTGYRSPYCRAWTVQRNLLNNVSHFCLFCANSFTSALIEKNRFMYGWGKEGIRGQIQFRNGIIRYNQFYDSCGTASPDACTGDIALWDGAAGDFDGNEIYGNWFYQSNTNGHTSIQDATITVGGDNGVTAAGPNVINTKVYNNTIVGLLSGGQSGFIRIYGGSTNECRNNLRYNVNNTSVSCGTTSNNTAAGVDPFVNYAAGNFHLSGHTAAGTTLASPYNVDMDGVTRGIGGWDVGAYQYVSATTPDPPTNFRLNVDVWWTLGLLGILGGFLWRLNAQSSDRIRRPARGRNGGGSRPAVARVVRGVDALARRQLEVS